MTGRNSPVGTIVDRFGGQNALARAVGVRQSTVWAWVQRGLVPSERIPQVIRAGKQLSPPVKLRPDDFFDLSDEAA